MDNELILCIKKYGLFLLAVSPLLASTAASSRSYRDDHMSPREIEIYLETRLDAGRINHSRREIKQLTGLLLRLCRRTGFTPETVLSVISTESSFRSDAVSTRGAVGLMQLMPETALYIAHRQGLYYRSPADLRKPSINLTIGVHYLAHLRDRFEQSKEYLAAYNMGPAKFRRREHRPVRSVERYVRNVQRGTFGVKSDAQRMASRIQ